MAWNLILAAILLYTGTIFPFRLVFLEFHIPEESPDNDLYLWIEEPINVLFWADLVIGFFLSFRDQDGKEVCNLRRIVIHYMCGYFWLNLLACAPDIDTTWVSDAISAGHDSTEHDDHNASLQRLMRLTRFRRIPRMIRLGRSVARIVRVMVFYGRAGIWRSLTHSRKVRVIRLLVCCSWIMHIFACGWYLCASLHADPSDTWVARRGIIDDSPVEQWVAAFYFVTTVFTTVGFGDMSAATWGEMIYACMVMVGGTIVNGILIGEIIHTVMVDSEDMAHVHKHLELIQQLSTHAELDEELTWQMRRWIKVSKVSRFDEDIESLTRLLTSATLPMGLMEKLPHAVYRGQLWRNRFLTLTELGYGMDPPPRLAMLVALLGYRRAYRSRDFVYRQGDLACNFFLVLEGTFAEVGSPLSVGFLNGTYESSRQAIQAVAALTGIRTRPVPAPNASGPLYPYRFWSHGNYFGEVELFTQMSRQASVRCESDFGSLLVVDKPRFHSLIEEFSDLAKVWRKVADQRRLRRCELLRQLQDPMEPQDFAASLVQRWFRAYLSNRSKCRRGRGAEPREVRRRNTPRLLASSSSDLGSWGGLYSQVGVGARLQLVEESLLRIEAALGARRPASPSKMEVRSTSDSAMRL